MLEREQGGYLPGHHKCSEIRNVELPLHVNAHVDDHAQEREQEAQRLIQMISGLETRTRLRILLTTKGNLQRVKSLANASTSSITAPLIFGATV